MNPISRYFYRTALDIVPSNSLVAVAASVIASSIPAPAYQRIYNLAAVSPHLAEVCNYPFYRQTAAPAGASDSDALQEFAQDLLRETVDVPSEVSALINKHFWELI